MFKYIFVVLFFIATNSNGMQFKAQNDGEIHGYFAGGSADYMNLMSVVIGNNPMSPYNAFHNLSPIGKEINFGSAYKNEDVTFTLDVISTGNKWYSDAPRNPDGFNHLFYSSFNLPDGTPALFVGFEDIRGGGDLDFNDSMAIFTNVSPVPEPEIYAMMLIGLTIIGAMAKSVRGNRHE